MPLCAAAPSTTCVCAAHALGLGRQIERQMMERRGAHEPTRVRALAPHVCAADAKVQCEAQMKYRIMRKEMIRPHQAILPRMPVMHTVRGTTNNPVDVL